MPDQPAPYTPNAATKPLTFAELAAAMSGTYLKLGFKHEGQEFAVSVRRLTSAETDAAAQHVRGLMPPVRMKYQETADGKPVHDFDNPSPELRAIITARMDEANKSRAALETSEPGLAIARMTFPEAAHAEKYDYEDEGYAKQRNEAGDRQITALLDKAIQGGIPGNTIDEKVTALKAALPETVIRLIARRVGEISRTGTIELSSFF